MEAINRETEPLIRGGHKEKRRNVIATIVCIAVLVLGLVVVGVGVGVAVNRSESSDTDLAATVLSNMNTSADPCNDFFQYSCGGWRANNPLLGEAPKINQALKLTISNIQSLKDLVEGGNDTDVPAVQLARQFYKSCMDTDAIDARGVLPLRDLVQLTGGWDAINVQNSTAPAWTINGSSLLDEHMYGSDAFFTLVVRVDDKNSSRYITKLIQSGLSMDPDLYSTSRVMDLQDQIINLLNLFDDADDPTSTAEGIVDVEKRLANASVDTEGLNATTMYNLYTLQELNYSFGTQFDWVKYVKARYARAGVTVPDDLPVVVTTPTYFQYLNATLSSFSASHLENYAKWHLVKQYFIYLGFDALETFNSFRATTKNLNMVELAASNTRYVRCIMDLQTLVPYTLSLLYTEHVLPSGTKEQIQDMASEIKTAFKQRLESNTWIDQPTRQASIDKVNAIKEDVAYPQFVYQPDELYARSTPIVLSGGVYFETFKFYNYQTRNSSCAKLYQPIDKSQWLADPTQVNAFYSPNYNKFEFEEGIMNPPFFKADWPDYFKFGAMGTVTGHELTHGFDNNGQLYNQNGTLTPWWTAASQQAFDKRKSCFVDQYSSYSLQDQQVNGQRTLGENIADNGGLKTAFQAYKNAAKVREQPRLGSIDLSPDQLFFVAFGQLWCSSYSSDGLKQALEDVHSPDPIRVLGALSNNEDFAATFNCPANSVYNPQHKCDMW